MPTYSQTGRPIRVSTPLPTDTLLLEGYRGTEAISRPFSFDLDLLSEEPALALEDLLRQPMVVTVLLEGGAEREIHGLVQSFTERGRREDLTFYRARIVPWLWFLSLSQDLKIFQNLSVLEIVEQVFTGAGYTDFRVDCTKSYAPREYCVQYRETHLDFVSRLLEEEGIFYFFEHSGGKHMLVLADQLSAVPACPGVARARYRTEPLQDEDVVTGVEETHSVQVGMVTLSDYDYLQPSLNLQSAAVEESTEEVYDYPGRFTEIADGERLARIQLEEELVGKRVMRGVGTCRFMQAGCEFELTEHHRGAVNGAWVLTEVRHEARGTDYRSWDDSTLDYTNEFTAVPRSVKYRPPRRTAKPVVVGTQTAVVVGPAGEEIYVDRHGRVKLQFYWDRDGRHDEKSSCWVRVASSWAGKGWGVIQIPRIGQEVIVSFLEADPDRPIVTGRVYNAEQVPPYDLPSNQTQSGIKSRSSKGGSSANFNEIRMEDAKGRELLYVHAEKDQQIVIENDLTETVGRDESNTIERDRTESVGRDETITIGDDRKETVGGRETVSIAKTRSHEVGDDDSLTVGGGRQHSVADDEAIDVGKSRSSRVGKDDRLDVGKNLSIEAGDSVTIRTGQAKIIMKKDGTIRIEGKNITVKGSGKVNVQASSTVTLKGSQVKQN